jgi:hypothetical protein
MKERRMRSFDLQRGAAVAACKPFLSTEYTSWYLANLSSLQKAVIQRAQRAGMTVPTHNSGCYGGALLTGPCSTDA